MPRRKQSETVQVGLRMKEPLRAALEEVARHRGVSMNAAIVARLERSFEQDQRIEDVFGSADLFGLMKAIASVMDAVGRQAGFIAGAATKRAEETSRAWIDHPFSYDQAIQAASRVLDAMRPLGEIEPPTLRTTGRDGGPMEPEAVQVLQAVLTILGSSIADDLIGRGRGGLPQLTQSVRADLGRLVDRVQYKPREAVRLPKEQSE